MPKLSALIFDLDGTLVDSAPDLRHALNLTLAAYDRRPVTLAEIKSFIGDGMLTTLNRAFNATGEAISIANSYPRFQQFMTHYRSQTADLEQIYPHVVTMLTDYHAKGVKLALCTNKQEAATNQLLGELNLSHFFSFIGGGDTFPLHKPHPGHVTGVIEGLKVRAENCVMIGDSTNDVVSAHGAGIPCLVVTHGYGSDYEKLGADALIASLDELPAALNKLGYV